MLKIFRRRRGQTFEEEQEMTFLQHLEELRWHIVRSLIAILVVAIAAFVLKDWVFYHVLLAPTRNDFITFRWLHQISSYFGTDINLTVDFEIQNRTMTGQFTTHVMVSFVAGLVVAFPYVFWEFWRFIKPGLKATERRVSRFSVFWTSLLFFMGVAFGYWVVAPFSINFLSNYKVDESVKNIIDLSSYINTLTMLVLSCGIIFELPMITYVASKAGLVTPKIMRDYRRHALVAILVLSAVMTPSDVSSMILVAIPLYLLYEISILVSSRVYRKRKKQGLV